MTLTFEDPILHAKLEPYLQTLKAHHEGEQSEEKLSKEVIQNIFKYLTKSFEQKGDLISCQRIMRDTKKFVKLLESESLDPWVESTHQEFLCTIFDQYLQKWLEFVRSAPAGPARDQAIQLFLETFKKRDLAQLNEKLHTQYTKVICQTTREDRVEHFLNLHRFTEHATLYKALSHVFCLSPVFLDMLLLYDSNLSFEQLEIPTVETLVELNQACVDFDFQPGKDFCWEVLVRSLENPQSFSRQIPFRQKADMSPEISALSNISHRQKNALKRLYEVFPWISHEVIETFKQNRGMISDKNWEKIMSHLPQLEGIETISLSPATIHKEPLLAFPSLLLKLDLLPKKVPRSLFRPFHESIPDDALPGLHNLELFLLRHTDDPKDLQVDLTPNTSTDAQEQEFGIFQQVKNLNRIFEVLRESPARICLRILERKWQDHWMPAILTEFKYWERLKGLEIYVEGDKQTESRNPIVECVLGRFMTSETENQLEDLLISGNGSSPPLSMFKLSRSWGKEVFPYTNAAFPKFPHLKNICMINRSTHFKGVYPQVKRAVILTHPEADKKGKQNYALVFPKADALAISWTKDHLKQPEFTSCLAHPFMKSLKIYYWPTQEDFNRHENKFPAFDLEYCPISRSLKTLAFECLLPDLDVSTIPFEEMARFVQERYDEQIAMHLPKPTELSIMLEGFKNEQKADVLKALSNLNKAQYSVEKQESGFKIKIMPCLLTKNKDYVA